jgi:hypothetical protein
VLGLMNGSCIANHAALKSRLWNARIPNRHPTTISPNLAQGGNRVNTLSPLFSVILMACLGACQALAGQPGTPPEQASIVEERAHETPAAIGKTDTAEHQSEGKKNPKTEIAQLRAEIVTLRSELESALKEIKRLKDAIGQGAAPKDRGPVFRGKRASFWLNQLKDGDPKFREEAVEALGSLAEKNKALFPVLVTALRDRDYNVGWAASKALASLGPEVIPLLLVVLKDKTSPTAVRGAADALARIRPAAKTAVPLLTEALKMDNWGVRNSCVTALGEIGPDARPALRAMVETLGVFLKKVEHDAKQGKTAKSGSFGRSGFPATVVDAVEKIDPDVRGILPIRLQRGKFGGPGAGANLTELSLFQQTYTAMKKRYEKEN